MKVIGIVGSPRFDQTTDAIVRQVLNGCEEAGASTEVFHLGGLEIAGCLACMECRETGVCSQHDDMTMLTKKIVESDALVIGTPIYFYYMTSQLKALTDRLFVLMKPDFTSRLGDEGRKAVLVVTQGAPDPDTFKGQITAMADAWKHVGIIVKDTLVSTELHERAQVIGNTDLIDRALAAGRELAQT